MIERPHASLRPHVILLGAGASRAAFPNSDKSSRPLPLMNDLVKILNIRSLVEQAIRIEDANFESVYSKLAAIPQYDEIRKEVELNVTDYFSSLQLPDEATIYDRILLSLRPEDAVFTFNWDPFLFDAYIRNSKRCDTSWNILFARQCANWNLFDTYRTVGTKANAVSSLRRSGQRCAFTLSCRDKGILV